MTISIQEIINEAEVAAKKAEQDYINRYLPNGDSFPCGFAWVNIKPAKGKLITELKARNAGHKSYYGGYDVWNPSRSNYQNVDCKYAAAQAYSEVLNKYGYKSTPESRWD
jgi:hypothetical protein